MTRTITMLTENGTICCRTEDPRHLCPRCLEAYKRGGPTRDPLANVLTTNSKIDVCDDAMEATNKANIATSKAQETSEPDDHDRAMRRHDEAADQHDAAADDREGDAALVHSVLATSHRAQAKRHAESRDYLMANDDDLDLADDADAQPATEVQNRNPKRRPKVTNRPNRQLIANAAADAERQLAYYRNQGLSSRAYDQLVQNVRSRQALAANCACQVDDSLPQQTLNETLGVAPPTGHTSARSGEFQAAGYCEDLDAVPPITMNFQAGDPSFDRGTGRAMKAVDRGYLFRGGKASGEDLRSIPGFELPDGNTGMYAEEGVRDVAPLTSGRPHVKPSIPTRSREDGGNISSYAASGVRGDQGSSDSAGDEQDDPDAPAGRSGTAARTRGSRSTRGRTVDVPTSQYDMPMAHEDRTDDMKGQVHTVGQQGSIYSSDFFAGSRPLPTEKYTVTQADRDSENRRKFGNQGAPTSNEEDDALVCPSIDYAELSAENAAANHRSV